MTHAYEMDLEPSSLVPRVRINFPNGWCASIVFRSGSDPTRAMVASLACAPTGRWGDGLTELGETEASPMEVLSFLAQLATRPEYGS